MFHISISASAESVCIPKGVSDKSEVLSFVAGNGVGSAIGFGVDVVETDTIDRVLNGALEYMKNMQMSWFCVQFR